jgi:hypothetical protein
VPHVRISANLFWVFFFKSSHKIVILSEAPHTDLSCDTALGGAESKDPEGAYLAYVVRSFSTTETRVQDLAAVPT